MRLSALLLLTFTVAAQENPIFRTEVSLVHIDAEVLSGTGRILTDFTKDDFRVLDEGKDQAIVHFSASQEALDLILLFDISGSMRSKVLKVSEAAREGVQELRQGDRIAVMAFNSRSRTVAPFTDDRDAVERSIQQEILSLPFGGGTFIQNAVSDAATLLTGEPRQGRRRAILVITDNYGQRTKSEGAVVRQLWEADALLTGLIVRSGAAETAHTIFGVTHPYMLALEAGVKGIAEKTGGDFIQSGEPGTGFRESMRRIRSRYTIYCATPRNAKPGTSRSLRTELSTEAAKRFPDARVRARTGYVVPAASAKGAPPSK